MSAENLTSGVNVLQTHHKLENMRVYRNFTQINDIRDEASTADFSDFAVPRPACPPDIDKNSRDQRGKSSQVPQPTCFFQVSWGT